MMCYEFALLGLRSCVLSRVKHPTLPSLYVGIENSTWSTYQLQLINISFLFLPIPNTNPARLFIIYFLWVISLYKPFLMIFKVKIKTSLEKTSFSYVQDGRDCYWWKSVLIQNKSVENFSPPNFTMTSRKSNCLWLSSWINLRSGWKSFNRKSNSLIVSLPWVHTKRMSSMYHNLTNGFKNSPLKKFKFPPCP